MEEEIKRAIEALSQGKIILYPTDTIWGIGCDATNEEAVEKIYKIKQRTDSKSMLVLIDTADKISRYIKEVPSIAWDIIEINEEPLTIIFPEAIGLAPNLIAADKSIGIRITKEAFTQKLIAKFKKPIVSTSANIHGKSFPANFDEISDEIKDAVDYIVNWRQDEVFRKKPSGIIKVEVNGEIKIIRE